jgi:3-dehydroquinate synthase
LTKPTTKQVNVDLGDRSYTIHIGSGFLSPGSDGGAHPGLAAVAKSEHVILFSDSNVAPIYLESVTEQLRPVASQIDSIVVPAGEASKSIAQCDQLWQKMVEFSADRQSIVVALGGGVVGDLAGFVAASFTRGIRFVQIPTTLLSQVDSSVGGKVGVNLPRAKNMVGAFWQPKTVLIDPLVLETLDEANYRAGMAEVIKYGLIMDKPLFEFLESSVAAINDRDPETLTKIIAWCCQCKATVVEEDEKETSGRRAILNYGHTYGHAIESVFGYGEFLHGEAIAIGMTCAGRLGRNLEMVDQKFLDRQTNLFKAVGLPTDCPTEKHDELIAAMKHDKKVARGKLNLILPTELGNVTSYPAPEDGVIKASLIND